MDGDAPRSGIRLLEDRLQERISDANGNRGQGRGSAELRTLLHGLFARHGKTPHLVLNTLKEHWSGIVGPGLALRCTPHRLERNTLWVAATDACWAYEMQFHKRDILRAVQTFIESDTVRDVRFGSTLSGAAGGHTNKSSAPPRDIPPTLHWPNPHPPEEDASTQAAGSHIADPSLQAAFTRTMRGAKARKKPKN